MLQYRSGLSVIRVSDLTSSIYRFFGETLDSGCIVWHGRVRNGAPSILYRNRPINVLEKLWKLEFGELPRDMTVARRCKNRRCVKTTHFYMIDRIHEFDYNHIDSETKDILYEKIAHSIIDRNSEGCWNWGKKFNNGSPYLCLNYFRISVTKFLYICTFGSISNDSYPVRACHNKRCINPEHLILKQLRKGKNA